MRHTAHTRRSKPVLGFCGSFRYGCLCSGTHRRSVRLDRESVINGTRGPFESGRLGVRRRLLLRFPCAGRCFKAARTPTAWRPELAAVWLARCDCGVGMDGPAVFDDIQIHGHWVPMGTQTAWLR